MTELKNKILELSINSSKTLAATAEMIKVDHVGEKKNIGLITLNRPKALNALCKQLMEEVYLYNIYRFVFVKFI